MVCSKIRKKVKDSDMFGHSVVLNFNRQGDTFKTIAGGLFSVIIKIVLIWYAGFRFNRMITKSDN